MKYVQYDCRTNIYSNRLLFISVLEDIHVQHSTANISCSFLQSGAITGCCAESSNSQSTTANRLRASSDCVLKALIGDSRSRGSTNTSVSSSGSILHQHGHHMSRKLELVRQKRKQQSALASEAISENAGLLAERQTTASSSDLQRNSTLCSELRFSETASNAAFPQTPSFSGVPPVPPGTPLMAGEQPQQAAKSKTKYQLAKELSDLVIYLQTAKFQGLASSPQMTVKRKRSTHLHSCSLQHQLAQMSHSASGQLVSMQRRITPHHSSSMLAAPSIERPMTMQTRDRAEGEEGFAAGGLPVHLHSSSNASLIKFDQQQQQLHRGGLSFHSCASGPQHQSVVQTATLSASGHSNSPTTCPIASASTSQQPPPPPVASSLRPRNRLTESVLSTSGVMTSARLHAPPICRQVYSLGETKAKQLCRRFPIAMLLHTEKSMFRTYPSGTRIDSSNFNPLTFWSFGLQMVALNYQTEDIATFLNTAMFEQNGHLGYILKPEVMRNKSHPLYGRFNPFDKESESLSPIEFSLTIISGQYLWSQTLPTCSSSAAVLQSQRDSNLSVVAADVHVHQSEKRLSGSLSGQSAPIGLSMSGGTPIGGNGGSLAYAATQVTPLVEVELLGIPCDSHKVRTKPFHKNAVNPIWNETFRMSVAFSELAFVRFGVIDVSTGHLIAQRVLPLKCLRPGYRHVQLRSPLSNQTLDLASLFVYTTTTELPTITPNRPTVALPEMELMLTSTSLTVPNSSTNSSACFQIGGTPDSGMPIEELQVTV